MGQPIWPHAPPPTPTPRPPVSPVEQGLCLLAMEGPVAEAAQEQSCAIKWASMGCGILGGGGLRWGGMGSQEAVVMFPESSDKDLGQGGTGAGWGRDSRTNACTLLHPHDLGKGSGLQRRWLASCGSKLASRAFQTE